MASKRGFASMDPEKRREICSRGGKAAQARGTGHRFTREEAIIAGRKGGQKISQNIEHMERIGKKGGEARGANRKREAEKRRGEF